MSSFPATSISNSGIGYKPAAYMIAERFFSYRNEISYTIRKNVPRHILAPRRGCFSNRLPLRRVRIPAERFYRMETKFPYDKKRPASSTGLSCIHSIYNLVLCSLCFFDLLGQSRQDLVQIANDAVVSNVEDRSCLIFVNCNDDIRLFHTSQVLNCTGDTDCKVYMRTNGLTGLSNLQVFGLPASIYNCTGAAYWYRQELLPDHPAV